MNGATPSSNKTFINTDLVLDICMLLAEALQSYLPYAPSDMVLLGAHAVVMHLNDGRPQAPTTSDHLPT